LTTLNNRRTRLQLLNFTTGGDNLISQKTQFTAESDYAEFSVENFLLAGLDDRPTHFQVLKFTTEGDYRYLKRLNLLQRVTIE